MYIYKTMKKSFYRVRDFMKIQGKNVSQGVKSCLK